MSEKSIPRYTLYAFWTYDKYPYVLGAEVLAMDSAGRVLAYGYDAMFIPIHIVPYDIGVEIADRLGTMKRHRDEEILRLNQRCDDDLYKTYSWIKKK